MRSLHFVSSLSFAPSIRIAFWWLLNIIMQCKIGWPSSSQKPEKNALFMGTIFTYIIYLGFSFYDENSLIFIKYKKEGNAILRNYVTIDKSVELLNLPKYLSLLKMNQCKCCKNYMASDIKKSL